MKVALLNKKKNTDEGKSHVLRLYEDPSLMLFLGIFPKFDSSKKFLDVIEQEFREFNKAQKWSFDEHFNYTYLHLYQCSKFDGLRKQKEILQPTHTNNIYKSKNLNIIDKT